MAEIKGGEKLEAFLSDMAKKVSNPATLRVGFIDGSTDESGTSNAMKAAINEFGAPSRGIPPRPFMRTTVANKSAGWAETIAMLLKQTNYDAVETLNLMGDGIKGQIQDSIFNGGWIPNKPSTLKRKAGKQPLVDTGAMAGSVSWEVKTE